MKFKKSFETLTSNRFHVIEQKKLFWFFNVDNPVF